MESSRIRKASDLVERIVSGAEGETLQGFYSMYNKWSLIVGEHCAAHSKPSDLRNNILYIETDHPGIIQMLQMNQKRILVNVTKEFPSLGVRALAFRLGSGDTPVSTGTGSVVDTHEDLEVDEDESKKQFESIKDVLEAVPDEDFRAVLSSLSSTLTNSNKKRK